MSRPLTRAELIAQELLGNIQYGDSRDNPAWREAVIASAARLIDRELKKAVVEAFNKLGAVGPLISNSMMDVIDEMFPPES